MLVWKARRFLYNTATSPKIVDGLNKQVETTTTINITIQTLAGLVVDHIKSAYDVEIDPNVVDFVMEQVDDPYDGYYNTVFTHARVVLRTKA
jgi:hypothetical protein